MSNSGDFTKIRAKWPTSSQPAQSSSGSSRGGSHSGHRADASPRLIDEESETDSCGHVAGKLRGKKPVAIKEPPHPDVVVKEEIFNQLEYCGFLDQTAEHLFRWAVLVIWSMQIYKSRVCNGPHMRGVRIGSDPPPILYRLFLANARLKDSIRQSATARALIVIHAVHYISKLQGCSLCYSTHDDVIDLSREDPRALGGLSAHSITRLVYQWAGAVKCATAWLTDSSGRGYWQEHTTHITDSGGAEMVRIFQQQLDHRFSISNEELIKIMHRITDDHPLELTPESNRQYRPAPGVHDQ